MEKANYECDLHCHSNRSDGKQSPKEVIDHAVERGVKVLALTDHDIRPPETVTADGGEMDIVQYAAIKGLKFIRGIEISCETEIDDVHIVGLMCNWKDSFFVRLENFTIFSKVEGYQILVQRLQEYGMDITWEEVLRSQGKPMEDKDVQKKYIFELMAEKGYVPQWQDAKLLVKNNPRLNVRREKPEVISVINRIHRSGGVAILAHPYLINESMEKNGQHMERLEFIDYLFENGLDGIEASYTYDKTSYDGPLTKEEIRDTIIKRYRKNICILSGGSDYHADGGPNQREIGECGISFAEFIRTGIE